MVAFFCLDIKLSGHINAIAAYLIPYSGGAILVDPGPGSTLESLKTALADHNLKPENITHVLLTHIHLDHAGAAGWLAGKGAQIYVHPVGVPHMLNPAKLLASARRIYGDKMENLWGDFMPVSSASLIEVQDSAEIAIGELRINTLHTPGHADHHVVYAIQDTCFSGDVGGVRKPGRLYLRLPFVPPETHIGKWRDSLTRIKTLGCRSIALTHFGIYNDAPVHLALACQDLEAVEQWLENIMPGIQDVETLQIKYAGWLQERGHALGIDDETLKTYDFANPVQMDASGLFRYWHKVRMAE